MNCRAAYFTFFFLLMGSAIYAQIQQPFSIRYSESLKGDFTIIANNMLSRTATSNYNGNNDNHDFNNNVYVDIDNDNSTFNSSNAVFTNPDLSVNCISIFKAYIYWAAADTERPNGADNQPNWNFDDIKLMLPGETTYTTITADDVIFRGRDTHFSNDPYICVKDITDEVMALPDKYGPYQVANVEAAEGQLSHSQVGTSGGWQIVFIYESPELPPKNITLFDGYAHVTSQVNDFDINFVGFQTTPVGNVNANLVMGVLEGDRNLTGDRLQILNVANNFVDLVAPLRNANNFFNSRITVGTGDYVNRTPASTNTLGFDASVFQLDNSLNSIITNNQTSATVRLTSTLEVYGLYLLGLAVEIYQPSLNPLVISQTSGTNPANPGDILGFNFLIENTGNDNALSVNLSTIIPPQATLLPITNLPNGVTYAYNTTTGALDFTIIDGLLDVGDPPISIDMELQINDECYFLEDDCDLDFDLQFTATYIGEVSSEVVISSSTSDPTSCIALPYTVNVIQPIVNWLTAAGALDATLSCEDSAGLAAAQSLAPQPDKCTFTLNKTSGPFVVGNCPNTGTYTNTWNFTDACGVTISDFVQVITIIDNIDPTATDPAPIQVQCLADVPVPDPAVVLDEADNCSIPTVLFVSETSDNQSCPETITRIYSVTDECNNSITVTHLITVNDDILPTASNPATIQVQCIGDVPTPDPAVVLDETDNCSIPTVAFVSDVSDNQTCPETITRTYSVTDDCNNSILVTQLITVNDDILPTASNPTNIQVQCISEVPFPDAEVVTDEADNCGVPTVAFVSDVSDNQSCPETITRTYSVTDDCNNSINVTQLIVVNDDILPTASNPAAIQIQCISELPSPDPTVVIDEADNCGVPTVAYVSDVSNNQTCPETITRTYSVTDACNNSITVAQIITILDDVLPTASDPQPIQVQCSGDIPLPDPEVVDDEADNCSVPTVEFVSDISDNLTCPETITRTYRITDACNNSITVAQLIIINDDILPTASNPAPVQVQCIKDVPSPDPAVVTDESDNCSVPTVTFIADVSNNETCPETITRTYRVTDDCGNSIEVSQLITIYDETAPELLSEFDSVISISCEAIPEAPALEFADNCSTDLFIDYYEETVEIDEFDYDILRKWMVYDDCDNLKEVLQTIQVRPTVEVDSESLDLCILDDPIDLTNLISNTSMLNGEWESESIDLLVDGIFNPANAEIGVYEFRYKYSENDCTWRTIIEINVNDGCAFFPCIESRNDVKISKLVTANNDGYNDFFEVEYILSDLSNSDCNISIDVEFFNRWGVKVFKGNNYDNDWNGTSTSGMPGGSGLLPTGTYYYVVTLNNSGLKPIRGFILLGTD